MLIHMPLWPLIFVQRAVPPSPTSVRNKKRAVIVASPLSMASESSGKGQDDTFCAYFANPDRPK
jgi:hypothetical protein